IDAAVLSIGVALESTLMMEQELRSGALIAAVPDAPRIRLVTQWIVCPHAHLRQKKVRIFLDWLRKERDDWKSRPAQG
ncbi:LysR substrate-binding domain-containing protein, partial [Paraburkholderia sp. SIMBA_009]